jgi:hypothetical protein
VVGHLGIKSEPSTCSTWRLQHPDRCLSLTTSNAGHVGGSIQKVETWNRIIAERGMGVWSDEFMTDRFHPSALSPERWEWFAHQQAAGDRDVVLDALAVLVGIELSAKLHPVRTPVLILHPDSGPFIPVAAELNCMRRIQRLRPCQARPAIFATARTCGVRAGSSARSGTIGKP